MPDAVCAVEVRERASRINGCQKANLTPIRLTDVWALLFGVCKGKLRDVANDIAVNIGCVKQVKAVQRLGLSLLNYCDRFSCFV